MYLRILSAKNLNETKKEKKEAKLEFNFEGGDRRDIFNSQIPMLHSLRTKKSFALKIVVKYGRIYGLIYFWHFTPITPSV